MTDQIYIYSIILYIDVMNQICYAERIVESIDIAKKLSISLPCVDIYDTDTVSKFIDRIWRLRYTDRIEARDELTHIMNIIDPLLIRDHTDQ